MITRNCPVRRNCTFARSLPLPPRPGPLAASNIVLVGQVLVDKERNRDVLSSAIIIKGSAEMNSHQPDC